MTGLLKSDNHVVPVAAAYLTDPVAMTRPRVPMPRHILLDCPELRDVRLKYFTASSLKDIFESVDNQNIIGFIKDAHYGRPM